MKKGTNYQKIAYKLKQSKPNFSVADTIPN